MASIMHEKAWRCPGTNCLNKDLCMRYKEGSTESMPIMQIGKSKVDPELKDSSFADPRFDLCTDFWRIDDPAHFHNLEDEDDFIF